jgi:hypothetical protein
VDFATKVGIALAIGGIGVSCAVFFATYLWREMPRWLALLGFGSGLLLCVGAIVCFIVIPNPEEPEVTLSFAVEKDGDIQLHNVSGATANNIKWGIVGFNLSQFPQNKQPLQIPISIFDFLPARASSGLINTFRRPGLGAHDGDKFFGSASVVCPSCKRGHTYVFFFTLGTGGWYGEELKIADGSFVTPGNMDQLPQAADEIERRIPKESRISIQEPIKHPLP